MDHDPTKSHNIFFNTSDSDGSGNWAVIQARDPAGAADPATRYPAFNWANSYSAPGFTSGWYLPARDELNTLYAGKSAVEAAYSALGMTSPLSSGSWITSSQHTDNTYVWGRQWYTDDTGNIEKGCPKYDAYTAWVARVFN